MKQGLVFTEAHTVRILADTEIWPQLDCPLSRGPPHSLPTCGSLGRFAQLLTREACVPEIKPTTIRNRALGVGCSLLRVWGS